MPQASFSDAKVLAQRCLDFTQDMIDACGSRLMGTPACEKSGRMIAQELKKHCDKVALEKFFCHPESFLFFAKFYAITYGVAALLLIPGGFFHILAALLLTLGTFFSLSQIVFYWRVFDRFFEKKAGFNVVGILEPEEEPQRQIIVSGHHDSPYEFNFLASRWQRFYSVRITMAVVTHLCLTVTAILLALGILPGLPAWAFLLIAAGYALVLPMYFFRANQASPGAGDNMIACAISVVLAQEFGQAKKKGQGLKSTRLIFACFDAEEAGLRGARAYARRHYFELTSTPTFVFNMDSIYDADEIKFLTSDVNGFVKLSQEMADQCVETGKKLGYPAGQSELTFGGGGTDAGEFARIGVPATTLLGMSTKMIRTGLVYHTMEDTVDKIQPQSVEASVAIARQYILDQDK